MEDEMQIEFGVLGKPLSQNAIYRRRKQAYGMFMTTEGKKWKEEIAWAAKMARMEYELQTKLLWDTEAQYHVDLGVYWNDKRRRDAHNVERIPFDALEGVLYDNDSQVISHSCKRLHGEPKITIKIRKLYGKETI